MKSILFLSANPKGSMLLRLNEEEREIKERLRLAGYGKVPIQSTGAARPRDMQQAMLDVKPQIVHFSGHGAEKEGLVFEDAVGQAKLVDAVALSDLFKLFSSRVECVILNSCYSEFQANEISQHIDYVIGMKKEIGDQAAIEFSVGFYTALGAGESIEFAYLLGCNAIQLAGLSEEKTPILIRKIAPQKPHPPDDKEVLQVNAELVNSGQSISFKVNPRVSVKYLTRKFADHFKLNETAETGGFSRLGIRWVLVDKVAEDFWKQLSRTEQAEIYAIVANTGMGMHRISYSPEEPLSEIGTYDNIVFHLYVIEDHDYYSGGCPPAESVGEAPVDSNETDALTLLIRQLGVPPIS
jgi:hypothetical protein